MREPVRLNQKKKRLAVAVFPYGMTISAPARQRASISGISAGGCCMSASSGNYHAAREALRAGAERGFLFCRNSDRRR